MFPGEIRRGLLRIYIVFAVPWTLWFSYKIFETLNTGYYRRTNDVSYYFLWMLLVPIGAPVALLIAGWVRAGFKKESPPAPDYEPLLRKAVNQLSENNSFTRQSLYDRAEAALNEQLGRQGYPDTSTAQEQQRLSTAIRRIERSEHAVDLQRQQKAVSANRASTLLLAVSLGAPTLWVYFWNEMSLYWIARPRR